MFKKQPVFGCMRFSHFYSRSATRDCPNGLYESAGFHPGERLVRTQGTITIRGYLGNERSGALNSDYSERFVQAL
jgi:hypothetical protein